MSDIGINLDGVITFLVAAALGLLLLLGILITASVTLIRARQNQQPLAKQRSFAQIVGMFVSFCCCAALVLLLLYADRMPPPRTIGIWLDRWLWVWLIIVIALWPISSLCWKKWSSPVPQGRRPDK